MRLEGRRHTDVLEEKNDSRNWELRSDETEQLRIKVRGANVLEATGYSLEDRNIVVGDGHTPQVDPGEDGEEDDDESGSKGSCEECDSFDDWVASFLLDFSEGVPNAV